MAMVKRGNTEKHTFYDATKTVKCTLEAAAVAAADGGGRGARKPIPALSSMSTSVSSESSSDGADVADEAADKADADDGEHKRARAHAASAPIRVRIAPQRAMARAWCGDSA